MVKDEPSSSDSSSDNETPKTPLAASTQRSPSPAGSSSQSQDSDSDDSATGGGFDEYLESLQADNESNTGDSLDNTLENYLSEFRHIEVSEPRNCVDVDLTDSDDEVWIIKCPKFVNAKKNLLGATLEKFRHQSVSMIKSKHSEQLEAYAVTNKKQKPVTIMSGTKFQSFVPEGTVQIRETIEVPEIDGQLLQTTMGVKDDEIRFPDDIRDRHPLLGFSYKSALKLPKRVKKALSMAQQRSDAHYLKSDVNIEPAANNCEEQKQHVKIKKSKKRKHDDLELSTDNATGDMIQMLIKEEGQSPSPKKKKKLKKETVESVEDDLSWLNNM